MSIEMQMLDGRVEGLFASRDYLHLGQHYHLLHLMAGLYVYQLQQFTPHFSRRQLLILKSEDFYGQTSLVMDRVSAFLGLEPLKTWKIESFEVYNRVEYPEMDVNMRKRLADFFTPHNRRLYDWLGADLGWE